MTEQVEPADNAQYLTASLRWLRLVLDRAAATPLPPPGLEPTTATEPPRRRRARWRGQRDATDGTTPPHPRPALPRVATVSAEEVSEAAAERERAAAAAGTVAPLIELAQRLGLSEFERDLVLLCAAIDLDPTTAARCARVQGDPALAFPTFALALSVLSDPAWDATSPHRPLRYWRLLDIGTGTAQSITTAPLRANERIVAYVKGLNELDEELAGLVSSVDLPPTPGLPGSQLLAADEIIRRLEETPAGGSLPVVQLLGSDARSKRDVAAVVAERLGRRLLRVGAAQLPRDLVDIERLARLWQRESMLLPVALYVDAETVADLPDQAAIDPAVDRFLARTDGVLLLAARDVRRSFDRATAAVDVPRASPSEQRAIWTDALGRHADAQTVDGMTAHFDLAPSTIHELAAPLADDERASGEVRERLWDACIAVTRVRLDALAHRVESAAGWDDLVLPDAQRALLDQIADQVAQRTRVYQDWGFAERMTRGLGISALFTGPSGVGKTLAAEVLANELGLVLYRIDLSSVVSKYIGETEKNLRALFDAAEESPALLLFDEADALFGRRSVVKDAHDRYANIEIDYLLQRMEAYRGLAILATNMKAALDQAFLRRLRFVVAFPFPDLVQRRAIWERVFPAATPTGDLDFDRLARLPLSGGMIHNVAVNAAFSAASGDKAVLMPIVLQSARVEFAKLELPVPEAELTWREPAEVAT